MPALPPKLVYRCAALSLHQVVQRRVLLLQSYSATRDTQSMLLCCVWLLLQHACPRQARRARLKRSLFFAAKRTKASSWLNSFSTDASYPYGDGGCAWRPEVRRFCL